MSRTDTEAVRRVVTSDRVVASHAALVKDVDSLTATILRTRSVYAREVLASLAWPGHRAADLEAWAESGCPWPVVEPGMDPVALGQYGYVLAVQTGDPSERRRARRILEALAAADLLHRLRTRTVEMLAQLRLLAREREGVLALLNHPKIRQGMRQGLRVDLANPSIFRDQPVSEWLERLNETLHSHTLAELEIGPPTDAEGRPIPLFDRMRARCHPVESPHKVTVLMSAYQPDPFALRTAVRSIVEQTWTNLELLVVDDASGPEYDDLFAEIDSLDPRIRVIRKAINGGPYRARNTGLRLASGDFCTALDADDWYHPQAIERLVTPLMENPGLIATRGLGVRVTNDVELNRPGYLPRIVASSTLTFRLPDVLDRIGWFDSVGKGGDTEFIQRMLAAFGPRLLDLNQVLLLIRSGNTLSSRDFAKGWRDPSRFTYRVSYSLWHHSIRRAAADPFLEPEQPRRFPEPLRWHKPSDPLVTPGRVVDVCFAGDWRRHGGPQNSMLEEIRAARQAGLTVGVMHLEALRFMTTQDLPLCDAVVELLNSGDVQMVQLDDAVHIRTLLLRYPPILQFPPVTRTTCDVDRLLVVANQAPAEPDGSDARYTVRDVTERGAELFGVEPVWVPQSPRIRRLLLEQEPHVKMTDWDNPGIIDADEWQVRDGTAWSPPTDRPIAVGRFSRDDHLKFAPTFEEVLRGYDFDPARFEVRMLGAPVTVRRLARRAGLTPDALPANWVLLRHGAQPVRDFLAELDFVLYLDNETTHEAFGRSLLEAAASGVLTIAHPRHRETFGDVLDYALPGEAQTLIEGYLDDPARYRARVRRTRELVSLRYGPERFVDRLRSTLPPLVTACEAPAPAPPVGEARIEVSRGFSRRPVPQLRTPAGWRPRTVQLRAFADSTHPHDLALCHAAVSDEPLRVWLWDCVGDHQRRRGVEHLLERAPHEVGLLAMVQDNLLVAAARARQSWDDAARDRAAHLSDLRRGDGWDVAAWWLDELPADGVVAVVSFPGSP